MQDMQGAEHVHTPSNGHPCIQPSAAVTKHTAHIIYTVCRCPMLSYVHHSCRYADSRPLLVAQLVSLEEDFPSWRSIAGDGNCFYRSALFGVLEHVLVTPDPDLGGR